MWREGKLVRECTHTGNSAITQNQPTLPVNTQQTSSAESMLFPVVNYTLSQTITAETPISTQVWQNVMNQLNKVSQDNKLLKKADKKKVPTKPSIYL